MSYSQIDPSAISYDNCFAMGWGKDSFDNSSAYQVVLRDIEMDLVDSKTCEKQLQSTRLGPNFALDKSFTCAGGEFGVDTCTGDGGGPLVCAGDDTVNIRGSYSSQKKTYYQVSRHWKIVHQHSHTI